MVGKLILVPTPISEQMANDWIAPVVLETLQNCNFFFVENSRTARRFISSLRLGIKIKDLCFTEMPKHGESVDYDDLFLPVTRGQNLVILSEAGLPCLADPGSVAVSAAHLRGIEVHTLPGISSITSGLISSGFNGQHFTFHGYLPIDKIEKRRLILYSYEQVKKHEITQIFIETPYRSEKLFHDLIECLPGNSYLYIGSDLTGKNQISKTKTISEWKANPIKLEKVPTVFILGDKGKATKEL